MKSANRPTRVRIVQSASRLFYRKGVRTVSMDDIARAASVTKMTVYQHFRSKRTLLLDTLRARQEERQRSLAKHIAGTGQLPPAERLSSIFDWLYQRWTRDGWRGCPFVNAAAEMAPEADIVRKAALESKVALRNSLRELATNAQIPHPKKAADVLLLLIEGATIMAMLEKDPKVALRAKSVALSLIRTTK
ncbi:MAG: TetR/AcrR family transcriptional regulator [Candidatus Micrarchaeaceae archaeon]